MSGSPPRKERAARLGTNPDEAAKTNETNAAEILTSDSQKASATSDHVFSVPADQQLLVDNLRRVGGDYHRLVLGRYYRGLLAPFVCSKCGQPALDPMGRNAKRGWLCQSCADGVQPIGKETDRG